MGSEKWGTEVAFAPGEADRRIAGISAAGRIARDFAEQGSRRLVLALPEGAPAPATLDDIRRLCPDLTVEFTDRAGSGASPAPRLDSRAIMRATGKAGDGVVSRWLNRPVSRFLSGLLLRIPGVRPLHATIGTAALAAAMFAALLLGGEGGLIAGGLLFHAASVFDGVDGEIARATFRTSRLGAMLDTVIDMATNVLFVGGATINLAAREPWAAPVGGWGLLLFVLGLLAISRAAAREDRPFSMDLVKERYRARFPGASLGRVTRFLIAVTSRDFFALLFAALILTGLPMAVLYLFAAAATLWILFVAGALLVPAPATTAEGSA